jgi:hypothetical protein
VPLVRQLLQLPLLRSLVLGILPGEGVAFAVAFDQDRCNCMALKQQ